VNANDVVTLSSTELASTHEQKEAREKQKQEIVESRRLDWMDEHKKSIQLSNGIDPTNQWDYEEDDGSNASVPGED
jgi:hypothetical protein